MYLPLRFGRRFNNALIMVCVSVFEGSFYCEKNPFRFGRRFNNALIMVYVTVFEGSFYRERFKNGYIYKYCHYFLSNDVRPIIKMTLSLLLSIVLGCLSIGTIVQAWGSCPDNTVNLNEFLNDVSCTLIF